MASFAGCVVTAFYLVLYSLRATLCISGMMLSGLGVIVLTGVMIWGRTRQQKGQPQ
jgi:hypothetical protein